MDSRQRYHDESEDPGLRSGEEVDEASGRQVLYAET